MPDTARFGTQVTLKDVAELARVHLSTASRALDPAQLQRISTATVAKVQAAATELGYTPDLVAAGLKRGRTTTVGVVVGDFDNPYIGPLIRGIAGVLDARGFVALVAETAEDRERLERTLKHLVSRRVDAIITTAAHLDDARLLRRLLGPTLPLVLAVRSIPGSSLPAVIHDDFRGAELAAEHLIDLSHRVVAQLCGPVDIDTFVRRTEGFRTRVATAGLVDVTVDARARVPTLGEGRRLMKLTLERATRRPTAIFAHNDLMAVGALETLEAASLRCPDDVSIIGYNDVPLASHLSPALTTIRMPSEELGRCAGQLALDLIEGAKPESDVIRIPATLVVRDSTRPLVATTSTGGNGASSSRRLAAARRRTAPRRER